MHAVRGYATMTRRTRLHCRGLYAITAPHADLLARAAAALRGGARLLQYRDKTRDDDRRLDEARALRALCVQHGALLIINDDVRLAQACAAHGVHLGADDADPLAARAALGTGAIIGVSCYDDLDRARHLATLDVDYVAFGAFFVSPTKPDARHATPELLRAAGALGLPRVAIGGITPDNGALLIEAGADYLAVISGVFGSDDCEAAARRYARLFP